LRSPSHPYFKNLHPLFYSNNTKIINKELLDKCTHPIFLTSLYLDDGSLTISYNFNKNSNTVYCHPSIILYTLNFTHSENKTLARHLNKTFKTNFVVSGHPDGHQSLLKLNKASEVELLLGTIKPISKEIPSMEYKTNISKNIELKKDHLRQKYGKNIIIKISSSKRRNEYTQNEIDKIILLKRNKYTDKNIANELGRNY